MAVIAILIDHVASIAGFLKSFGIEIGDVTLSGGAGSTVITDAKCQSVLIALAIDSTAAAAIKATWSGATITWAGTTTDVLKYLAVYKKI